MDIHQAEDNTELEAHDKEKLCEIEEVPQMHRENGHGQDSSTNSSLSDHVSRRSFTKLFYLFFLICCYDTIYQFILFPNLE